MSSFSNVMTDKQFLIKEIGIPFIKKIGISLTAAKPPAERSEANKFGGEALGYIE